MDAPATTPPAPLTPAGRDAPLRVRLPFVSTSFATDVRLFALLWPLWWVLGLEQFLVPIFVFWEFARFLVANEWQLRLNSSALFALLLAAWWVVPVFWVDPAFLDIFLKETLSAWAQFFMLVLIWNLVRTRQDWSKLVDALTAIAAYTVAGSAIFLAGIWRGQFLSLVGRLLPQSLVDSSSFFSSIAYRQFGLRLSAVEAGLFSIRLNGVSLSFSSLSMLCLLLMPLMVWRAHVARGAARRLFYLALAGGLFVALVYTESRIAYVAFLLSAALYVALRLHLFRATNRPLTAAVTLGGIGIIMILVFLTLPIIINWFETFFVDLRPGSWLVRFNIYIVTLRLLPEHPIAGWGVPVRIPGAASVFSAGTHSSYLGMLFQHGIIGLLLYLAIWISVWKHVIRGLGERHRGRERALFWIAMATAFFAFNIREIADSWWWDQSLTFVVWLMWGMAMTAQFIPGRPDETPPASGA
jgi:hypothetical protein